MTPRSQMATTPSYTSVSLDPSTSTAPIPPTCPHPVIAPHSPIQSPEDLTEYTPARGWPDQMRSFTDTTPTPKPTIYIADPRTSPSSSEQCHLLDLDELGSSSFEDGEVHNLFSSCCISTTQRGRIKRMKHGVWEQYLSIIISLYTLNLRTNSPVSEDAIAYLLAPLYIHTRHPTQLLKAPNLTEHSESTATAGLHSTNLFPPGYLNLKPRTKQEIHAIKIQRAGTAIRKMLRRQR